MRSSILCLPLLVSVLSACAPPSQSAVARPAAPSVEELREKHWDESRRAREAELLQEPDDIDAEVPQTLPSAQRFLAKLVARGGVTMEAESDPGWNNGWDLQTTLKGKERIQSKKFAPSIVLGSSDVGECGTEFRMDHPPIVTRGEEGERVVLVPPLADHGKNFYFQWPRVPEVEQEGAAVLLSGLHTKMLRRSFDIVPARVRVNLPSEALAIRVAYVFELLRAYCKEAT